jgi:hypothetical protein
MGFWKFGIHGGGDRIVIFIYVCVCICLRGGRVPIKSSVFCALGSRALKDQGI